VELHSPDLALEPAGASRSPLDSRATALPALALHHLASEQGAEIETERTAGALTLRLFLPPSRGEGGSTA